jgi:hypothetical protein
MKESWEGEISIENGEVVAPVGLEETSEEEKIQMTGKSHLDKRYIVSGNGS